MIENIKDCFDSIDDFNINEEMELFKKEYYEKYNDFVKSQVLKKDKCDECEIDIMFLTLENFDIFKSFFNHNNIYVNSIFNIYLNIQNILL